MTFPPFCNKSQLLHLPSQHILRVAQSEPVCLVHYFCLDSSYLGPKSPYLALSRQNLAVTSIRFSYTSTISLTEPFTPSFLHTTLSLPPTPRDSLELGPPITVCQGACPNGAWCQSTQELPRLKPRETLHLPFPPLLLLCPSFSLLSSWWHAQLLARDGCLEYVNRKYVDFNFTKSVVNEGGPIKQGYACSCLLKEECKAYKASSRMLARAVDAARIKLVFQFKYFFFFFATLVTLYEKCTP